MPGHSARFVLVVWWVTCLLWSSVWLCIKIGVGDVPPATFASARLIIALLVLPPVIALRRLPLPHRRRAWMLIGATGFLLLGTVPCSLTPSSVGVTTIGPSSVLPRTCRACTACARSRLRHW